MRHVAWGLIAYACVICAAHTASAQNRWYVEGSAGTQLLMDASRSTTLSSGTGTIGPGTSTATYDPGFVANLGLGYRLPFGIRVEGEVGYAHYSASSVSPLSTNGAIPFLNGSRLALQSGGGHDHGSATANAFYDLPISGGLVPYLGGGFGAILTGSQGGQFAGPNGIGVTRFFTQLGGSVVNPVILGEVGLNMAFNANWAVVPSYRFEHVFTASGAYPINANIFKLGVRYSW